jgi:hypothetical protein
MKRTLIIALLGTLALPAYAADPAATPGVDKRQATQQQRIDQGVKSGALTTQEAEKLQQGQAKIEAAETKAKADGTVTSKERERLHHMQDSQSKKIYREKHDRQHDLNHDGKQDKPRKAHHKSRHDQGKHKGRDKH